MQRAIRSVRALHVSSILRQTQLEKAMIDKLKEQFNTDKVEVIDQSGGCGSAFRVTVESNAFQGLTTIKQHRLVQAALKDEVANMHSIQVFTSSPK